MVRVLLASLSAAVVTVGCSPGTSSEATTTGDPDLTSVTGGSTSEGGAPVDLVAPDGWSLSLDGDPFMNERPDNVSCAAGWGEEEGLFEVDTDVCNYGAFVQPSLASIEPGDVLELVLVHDDLFADGPATAHMALAIEETIAWSEMRELPSPAEILRPTWVADASLPVGTNIFFHVHNHGANNYRLVALTRTRP